MGVEEELPNGVDDGAVEVVVEALPNDVVFVVD